MLHGTGKAVAWNYTVPCSIQAKGQVLQKAKAKNKCGTDKIKELVRGK